MDEIEKMLQETFLEATKAYRSINDYVIEIGVIDDAKTSRTKTEEIEVKNKKGKLVKKKVKAKVDITNAELMFIHEKGSKLKNIPARPVLQMTINYAKTTLLPNVLDKIAEGCFNKNWTKNEVKEELEKTCIRLQSYARKLIYSNDGSLLTNAPSTIKRKGDNHPLFDTGQLARSITCQLIKK